MACPRARSSTRPSWATAAARPGARAPPEGGETSWTRATSFWVSVSAAAALLHQVRVAHADVRVVVVERDLGLRPQDHLALGRVGLDAAREPDGVAILVGHGAPLGMLADEPAAVVVEPVEVVAAGALPDKVRGAGVLHRASVGVAHVLGRRPGVAAVAAVGAGGVAVDGAIDGEERPITEHRVALLLGDGPPPGGVRRP